MLPFGSSAARRLSAATATYNPRGDQLAWGQGPRWRVDPSAAAVQVPPGPESRISPGDGREERFGAACWTPSALVISRLTVAPAGESTRTPTISAIAGASTTRRRRRRGATGS